MEIIPYHIVWEITLACNMRCQHCGSAASSKLPGELTTNEALQLCDDLVELGTKKVTLSGGEPLLRPDWPQLAKRLTDSGVLVNMISNGLLVDNTTIDTALSAKMKNFGLSIDGLEDTHDYIRKSGSFRQALKALSIMRTRQFPSTVITTIMKRNLPELLRLKDILVEFGVNNWQWQIGCPMGNLAEKREEIIAPRDVLTLFEIAEGILKEKKIKITFADCLGYYSKISDAIRKTSSGTNTVWAGCPAGNFSLGIRHNGDICGCNSIRDDRYIEGNIREKSLKELWMQPGAFAWNRDRTRESLSGFCKSCRYGDLCLAGCTSARLTLTESTGEYTYCVYHLAIEDLFSKVEAIHDIGMLLKRATQAIEVNLSEVADKCLSRALRIDKDNAQALRLAGYVAYKLGDYRRCREYNEKVLCLYENDAYAMKGLGLALVKLGNTDSGITMLRESLQYCTIEYMDPYHDLAIVLDEKGLKKEAYEILKKGRRLSKEFRHSSADLYERLKTEISLHS